MLKWPDPWCSSMPNTHVYGERLQRFCATPDCYRQLTRQPEGMTNVCLHCFILFWCLTELHRMGQRVPRQKIPINPPPPEKGLKFHLLWPASLSTWRSVELCSVQMGRRNVKTCVLNLMSQTPSKRSEVAILHQQLPLLRAQPI